MTRASLSLAAFALSSAAFGSRAAAAPGARATLTFFATDDCSAAGAAHSSVSVVAGLCNSAAPDEFFRVTCDDDSAGRAFSACAQK